MFPRGGQVQRCVVILIFVKYCKWLKVEDYSENISVTILGSQVTGNSFIFILVVNVNSILFCDWS